MKELMREYVGAVGGISRTKLMCLYRIWGRYTVRDVIRTPMSFLVPSLSVTEVLQYSDFVCNHSLMETLLTVFYH